MNASADLFRSELLTRRDRLQRVMARPTLDEHLFGLLSEVDAALERLDQGTYGLCDTCHEAIEADRLLADPLLRYCLDHLTPSEQRALQQDLDLAAEIQRGLLPNAHLRTNGWEVAHHFAPLGAVSGDYCDVVLPDGEGGDTYFLLGDVSGKGVAASILMGNLHATFRTLIASGFPVPTLMSRANRLFCESTIASQYATLVCVKASAGGDIEVASAGHCPTLLSVGGRTQVMSSGALPLGMFCTTQYPTERARLGADDVMLLYSDGLIESRNRDDEEYGHDRLVAMFESLDGDTRRDARSIAASCLAHLTRFAAGAPRRDDLTIMAVRRP